MSQSAGSQAFLSGKMSKVDIPRIENELRALWKQATNSSSGIAGDIVRAVSFTLLIFATDEDAEADIGETLDQLVSHHPCRAIVTYYRQDKPHDVDAWVTARCHLLDKNRHVCSEQITVRADGASPEELSSVISPLVLSDLPVVLWWRSRNLATPVMEALGCNSRKVIFDSGFEPFSVHILQQAADFVLSQGSSTWLADLNWRRLTGWRRSLADAFDGFPLGPEYLEKITGVEMEVEADANKADVFSAQALLLISWFAKRLGWHHQRETTPADVIRFKRGRVPFDITLSNGKNNITMPGGITRVSMLFDDRRRLDVCLERNDNTALITSQIANSDCKECTRVELQFEEPVLVGQELELMTRDRIFEQSLITAGEITRVKG